MYPIFNTCDFRAPHNLSPEALFTSVHDRIHGPGPRPVDWQQAIVAQAEEFVAAFQPREIHVSFSTDSLLHYLSVINTKITNLDRNKDVTRTWRAIRSTGDPTETASGNTISIFLATSSQFDPRKRKDWNAVLVIGQLNDDSVSYGHGLIDLADLATGVFACQPTRSFLHGLYIRGHRAEHWSFDRSGLYCRATFDLSIEVEWSRFLGQVYAWSLLSDNDLGRSSLSHVQLLHEIFPAELEVQQMPFTIKHTLVGAGTACFLARKKPHGRWDHAVKIKWCWSGGRPEEEMLILAKKNNVQGVVSLEHFHKFDSTNTEDLRGGHFCGNYRSLSADKGPSLDPNYTDRWKILQHTEESRDRFELRTLNCFVLYPAGRPLRTFKSARELLVVLRDVLMAHRSLFKDARIIHQDISADNIIIVDPDEDELGHVKGMLIDLDVALPIDKGPRTPHEVTGTQPFMAVDILKERPRTYRHDLESFFYVLLWVLIADGNEEPPPSSILYGWDNSSWEVTAASKLHYVAKENFGAILEEVPLRFRMLIPLIESLRAMLFPGMEEGSICIVTTSVAADALHQGMLDAFDLSIDGA
ncbi:hypothetical protein ANO11243_042170 [Dothideomycetidae sp. 11243]|nr:hypothetical protein ANO11243_042170 [fungal sp. No.11243]